MGNKRVSQLVEMTANEVANDDLFLIIDSSARESKKIEVQNIFTYLNASGSLLAVHALFADTASFILGSGVFGVVLSASYAQNASTVFSASFAQNSINSVSASNAITAAFALSAIVSSPIVTGSTYPITASYANIALTTKTSSYLQYSGFPNGTASYAFEGNHTVHADTASFLVGGLNVNTASYALVAATALNADSASFLNFNGAPNGTASFALIAGGIEHRLEDFGLFFAQTQSLSVGSISNLTVSSSMGTDEPTLIEAFGTAILYYTTSIHNPGTLSLLFINRLTGITGSMDTITINYDITPIMNLWNTLATGSISFPFTLAGQSSLFGQFYLAVTSSSDQLTLDPNRRVRFTVSSYANYVSSSSDIPIDFYVAPITAPITFSSFAGGPFHDDLAGLLFTGSSNIKQIDIKSQNITDIKYTWVCKNLTDLSCSNNNLLTNLNYSFPNTMSNLYCATCSLTNIANLSNTQVVNFDCSINSLINLPELPDTVEILNCSVNPLISLPDDLPISLQTLVTDFTDITGVFHFNDNLLTASLNNCLLTFLPTFPFAIEKLSCNNNNNLTALPDLSNTSMSYLSVSSCNLTTLPSMSVNMSSIDISSNLSLPNTEVLIATNDLVNNSVLSGSFTALGYDPSYSLIFYANLLILQSRDWTVNVAGFP